MADKVVIVPLYEYGDWVDHELSIEMARSAVRDMIRQMASEPISWLINGLTRLQLEELAGAVRVEMRERERAQSHPANSDVIKLLSDG